MLNFVQVQERRKIEPQEYIEYFEDYILSLTQKLGERGRFAKVSNNGGANMSDEEKVIHLTDDSFKEEVIHPQTPALVDFWAPWCGPCKTIGPLLEELAKEYDGRVKICKLNVDENLKTPAQYGVKSIPLLILFKDGESIDQIVGAVPKSKMVEMIQKAL